MYEEYADNFRNSYELFPNNKVFRILVDPTVKCLRLCCKKKELFDEIQLAFSVDNPGAFFSQRYGYHAQQKLYAINKFGYFQPGLVFELLKWIKLHYGDLQLIALSKKCQSFIQDILAPLDPTKYDLDDISNISNDLGRNSELNRLDKPKYEFRDYQYEAVKALLASGRGHGLIEIPTAGGKSFILANFIWNILKNVNREAKTLILVPNVQLVSQFQKDLLDYGFDKKDIAVFTATVKARPDNSKQMRKKSSKKSKADLDFDCNNVDTAKIVVSNRQYIFKNGYQLPEFDVLVCDEVHQFTTTASLQFISNCNAKIKVGCSGTLPKDKYAMWQLNGVFGKVVYRKEVLDLQKDGYISKLRITLLDILDREVEGNRNLLFHTCSNIRYHVDDNDQSGIFFNDAYNAEVDYFQKNYESLYSPILDYIQTLEENTLILFDRIEIGTKLFDLAKLKFQNKKNGVFYIDGQQKLEVRENVREQFEKSDGNVLFAQTATFSVGINIKRLTHVVFMFQGRSFSRVVQSIGRALRLHFSKKEAHLVDVKFNFKYSSRHFAERMKYYEEVYNKKKIEEIIQIEI